MTVTTRESHREIEPLRERGGGGVDHVRSAKFGKLYWLGKRNYSGWCGLVRFWDSF
jgi:hypothetical protein